MWACSISSLSGSLPRMLSDNSKTISSLVFPPPPLARRGCTSKTVRIIFCVSWIYREEMNYRLISMTRNDDWQLRLLSFALMLDILNGTCALVYPSELTASLRRCNDVETTSCAYWVHIQHVQFVINKHETFYYVLSKCFWQKFLDPYFR